MSAQKSPLAVLLDLIASLFGRPTQTPSRPPAPGATPTVPTPPGQTPTPSAPPAVTPVPIDAALQVISPRVLTVVFDPIVDPANGTRLLQTQYAQYWNSVDDLLAGYVADLEECSGGLLKFREVQRETVDHFPLRESGKRYAGPDFLQALAHTVPVDEKDLCNYQALADELRLVERVANDEFEEVWMFGPPYAGFYESRMVGAGAFWCNAPELPATGRRFVLMGFNYERGVGEMLEDMGHRAESMLWRIYGDQPGPANIWERFKRYDLTHPGQAEVGMMHWAPNSEAEYQWDNARLVPSKCDDWYNFPNFQGTVKQVNCNDWGGGGIRDHHKWWFKHLPKVEGSTNGIRNNWWHYLTQFNDPVFDRR